ncbi:Mce-associated membrane protein [Saccharothrix texasensis]|uniref:Mce-associated membrane protein n=1 Tax=Saccharothrix texasensis TaxID=103734 RepID=A0A3N1HBG4_9PSEU|nr:Mce-associated membrane protein [Saccharothrix texasensis]
MPPSRRRPVPTTPTTRPRVAGLRKRPDPGAAPTPPGPDAGVAPEVSPTQDTRPEHADADPAAAEPTAEPTTAEAAAPGSTAADRSPGAESSPSDRDVMRPTEATGLIEPAEGTDPAEDTEHAEDTDPAPRPRPTGRRRRAGEAVAPSVLADDDAARPTADAEAWAARHDDPGARSTRFGESGLVLPISLLVLAALLVGLGAWFQSQAADVRYNQALVDSGGTTEVAGQAREAVEKAFSYNFADVSATEQAANELLVGKAKCQYNAIFGPVRTLAPEQKLVVTVKAVSSGVTTLDGDRATVLLFLDQVTTRTTDNQSGGGIAMMRVGAQQVDGRWKVDNMEMFGQTGDQAAETAKC